MNDYTQQLTLLHPVGKLWDALLCEGSKYLLLLKGIAIEFTRVEDRAVTLLQEADPQTTVELLEEWETAANMPGECGQLGSTIAIRQDNLTAKITESTTDMISQFIATAEAYGFASATVTEYISHSVELGVDEPIYDEDWRFAITLNVPNKPVVAFNADSAVDESLGEELADSELECAILSIAPAHTVVSFNYV